MLPSSSLNVGICPQAAYMFIFKIRAGFVTQHHTHCSFQPVLLEGVLPALIVSGTFQTQQELQAGGGILLYSHSFFKISHSQAK